MFFYRFCFAVSHSSCIYLRATPCLTGVATASIRTSKKYHAVMNATAPLDGNSFRSAPSLIIPAARAQNIKCNTFLPTYNTYQFVIFYPAIWKTLKKHYILIIGGIWQATPVLHIKHISVSPDFFNCF